MDAQHATAKIEGTVPLPTPKDEPRDHAESELAHQPQLKQHDSSSEGDELEGPETSESHAKYQCPLCSSNFTRRHNLQGHLRTHAQQRPFPCSHCSKTFTRASDRNVHEREAHTRGLSNRYVCNNFVIKDKDGGASRECKGCGKSFTRLTTLKRHQESIVHDDAVGLAGLQEAEQQLREGVPLQAFSTWIKTDRMTDLAELNRSITEQKKDRALQTEQKPATTSGNE